MSTPSFTPGSEMGVPADSMTPQTPISTPPPVVEPMTSSTANTFESQVPPKKKSKVMTYLLLGIGALALICACVVGGLYLLGKNAQDLDVDSLMGEKDVTPTQEDAAPTEASDEDLPTVEGYSSIYCSNLMSSFLMPDGWFKYEESVGNGTEACFITKEEIVEGSMFRTGLSVNLIPGITATTGVKPSEYALQFTTSLEELSAPVGDVKTIDFGEGLTAYSREVVTTTGTGDESRVYYLAAGDDATDSLYLLWFESPESDWDSSWKNGEVMVAGILPTAE